MNKTDHKIVRSSCECGQPATVVLNSYRICQGCYDKDHRPPKAAKVTSEDWKLMFQYDNSDVDAACTRWLKNRGIYNEKGFGKIYFRSGQIEALLARL